LQLEKNDGVNVFSVAMSSSIVDSSVGTVTRLHQRIVLPVYIFVWLIPLCDLVIGCCGGDGKIVAADVPGLPTTDCHTHILRTK